MILSDALILPTSQLGPPCIYSKF